MQFEIYFFQVFFNWEKYYLSQKPLKPLMHTKFVKQTKKKKKKKKKKYIYIYIFTLILSMSVSSCGTFELIAMTTST